MESKFKWAANPFKLDRVMRMFPGTSEEFILGEYRKIAGFVFEEFVPEFNSTVETKSEEPKMIDAEVEFTAPLVGETKIVPPEVVEKVVKGRAKSTEVK